jgi:N-acetylglucosaminyldiphosphoundecaprenol N-acetyl-beta-D-mannosaminyltransferase
MASEPPDGPGSGRRTFLGAPVDPVTTAEALRAAAAAIASGEPCRCATLNAAVMAWQWRDAELRELLWRCDLVTADGQWVVWAARLLGHPVPERVTGVDLMGALLAAGHRVYVLGATETVLARAAAVIGRRYPLTTIAGLQHGYFAPHEEPEVVRRIAASRAEVLLVAMPTPAKERFVCLPHGVPFAIGVGGSVDVLAGARRRAPRLVQRIGLEWLVRFVQEPRRLAPVMRANAVFLGLVLAELARALRGRAVEVFAGSAGGGRRRAPPDRSAAAPPAAPRRRSPGSSPAPPDRDGPGTGRG